MCDHHAGDPYIVYREELIEAGLLIPLGVPGLYGRSGVFENVVDQFEHYITRMGSHVQPQPEVMRFPPLFSRAHYRRTGHINNFPDLMGSIHSFSGDESGHQAMLEDFNAEENSGADWTSHLAPAETMLVPAACYPLYPTAAGTLPQAGRVVDLKTFVFRHEPSKDPARMQVFRQREYVRLGTAEQAFAHRNYWLERGKEMLQSVGLAVEAVVANDPFFGRGGKMMKATQREQDLKYELVVPICSAEKPTAVSSCNYHLDHFGHEFGIHTDDGAPAHSACIGFGLERIALALFKTHGFAPERWPLEVREVLDMA